MDTRARPSYPAPAIEFIQSRVQPSQESSGLELVELGSGTGIFSRLLLSPPDKDATAFASKKDEATPQGGKEYPDWCIRSLYAVEPSEGMRETWQKETNKLRQANPDMIKAPEGSEKEIVTLNGGFSDLAELKAHRKAKGLKEEGWADAVMAAQAWHWAHPKYEEAVVSHGSRSGTSSHFVFSVRLPQSSNPVANCCLSGTTKSKFSYSSAFTISLS